MSSEKDVYILYWDDVVDALVKGGCDNKPVVKHLLYMYGTRISEIYLLISDNDQGEMDPSWMLYHSLEELFGVEEADDIIFTTEYAYLSGYVGTPEDEREEIETMRRMLQ